MLNCTVRARVYLSVRHAVRTRNRVSGDYRTHYRYPPLTHLEPSITISTWPVFQTGLDDIAPPNCSLEIHTYT